MLGGALGLLLPPADMGAADRVDRVERLDLPEAVRGMCTAMPEAVELVELRLARPPCDLTLLLGSHVCSDTDAAGTGAALLDPDSTIRPEPPEGRGCKEGAEGLRREESSSSRCSGVRLLPRRFEPPCVTDL